MDANTIEVLDMSVVEEKALCTVERYCIYGEYDAPLVLSWNDTSPREGFKAVGGGVAFVRTGPHEMGHKAVSAAPDNLGNNEFAWRDTAHAGKMIIVVILPANYVVKTLGDTNPSPIRFKAFEGRMAFYWDIGDQTIDVRWRITRKGNRSLDKLCADLNRSALDNQARESATVVDKDATPTTPTQQGEGYKPAEWEKITVAVLAAIIIVAVLYAALRKDDIPARNFALLRILLSAAMGVMGGIIPGFLYVSLSLKGTIIRAGSGLALGIVTYFFTPHIVPNDTPKQVPAGKAISPAPATSNAARHFEISAFDFSEDYGKRAAAGAWPQFDLKLRNPTNEPIVISGLRFNVKKVWKLQPTPDPISKPVAEVLNPSAIYDVVVGRRDEEKAESKPTAIRDGKVEVGFLGENRDPDIETFTKKVSHVIKAGEADRIILNYRVARELAYILLRA